MKRITFSLLALTLILPASGIAKTVHRPGADGFCGTTVSATAVSYARHKFNQRRLALERRDRLAVGQPGTQLNFSVTKQKNIAVIEDDGTIFPPPNVFDLTPAGQTAVGVQFKRSGPGTRAELFFGGVSGTRGNSIDIGDDDSRAIDLPFTFTFYGVPHTRVFLNSDGNLTFNTAESASSARSLGRFLEGPPRIAADFLDLDPSGASGGGQVYLLEEPGRMRVTWVGVPQFGLTDSNTFQVTLFPNGRITMAYEDVDATMGIVGVSPGGPGTINLVDLSEELPLDRKTDAIAEQFREVSEIDDLAAASAALSGVKDEYDLVVLFADFPVDLDGAFAYNAGVKNNIRGIGDDVGYDFSNFYGSNGRLEAFVQMGSLSKYPANPNVNIPGFPDANGVEILGHEVGHRWLAFTRFMRQGQRSTDLLGRQLGHWSFNLDSDASVMEGNDIRDNGDGTFTTVATYLGFSPLDLYLMGLNRASEVPEFFYVAGTDIENDTAPGAGVILTGQRRNVTVDQIIAAEGPRVPSFEDAQKKIQVFFILLGREGEPPSLASVKKVNQYRNRLSTWFREKTNGRGRIATWLRLRKNQAAQAPAGAAAPATLTAPPAAENPVASVEEPAAERQFRERIVRLEERLER